LPLSAGQPKKQSKRAVLWAALAGVIVLGLFLAGFAAVRLVRRGLQVREQMSSSDGLEAASKPVSAGAKSATEADVRKSSKEFRIRQWLEAYKDGGNHSAPWDTLAVGMINAWIENNFGRPDTNGPSVEEMCD